MTDLKLNLSGRGRERGSAEGEGLMPWRLGALIKECEWSGVGSRKTRGDSADLY